VVLSLKSGTDGIFPNSFRRVPPDLYNTLVPVRILELPEIRALLNYREVIDVMRDALLSDAVTPMPMHLDIPSENAAVHMKSSYRRGGKYFALKIASTFANNRARGLPTGNGMMLLCSAGTGEPVAMLADEGHHTDIRTAAVSALIALELGRRDTTLGILGTGIQARLQARMHAEVLPLNRIVLWGRSPGRTAECARDLAGLCEVAIAASPAEVAGRARLIVTVTSSRAPLLSARDIQPGTHISAVGADGPGKQELDPEILRLAPLVLADSLLQCERLGELQHAPDMLGRAVEVETFLSKPSSCPASVADFTGLGVEDLAIAEYVYERSVA
jgi:ornithine cyclodeaminase